MPKFNSMYLRNIFLLISVIFLVSTASAVTILVDSPIPQGLSWSFSINLGSLEGVDSAKVYVGDELAIEVFEFAGTKYVNPTSVSDEVLSHIINGDNLVISYVSKSKGFVDIIVKTISGEVEQDLVSESVEFFIPFDATVKNELDSKINNLQSTVNSQDLTISELESKLVEKDSQVDLLLTQNASLLNSINKLQMTINLLESSGKSNEEQLIILKKDLNDILVEQELARKNNPINAMFAFNESTNGLAAGAVVVLILLLIVGIVVRKNSDSIYSGFSLPELKNSFKGEDLEVLEPENKDSDLDEQADEVFRGKWAFMDEEMKK
jgi:uncharacterized coiled-coil protein SlyX